MLQRTFVFDEVVIIGDPFCFKILFSYKRIIFIFPEANYALTIIYRIMALMKFKDDYISLIY